VPDTTSREKLAQIAGYGATLVRIKGDVASAFRLAREAANELGWIDLATTYLSPYPTEGNKTVAYEIAAQLGWRSPDWLLVPVGSGPLLAGAFAGFLELQRSGLVERVPRMVAVQAEGCAPIYASFVAGATDVQEWSSSIQTVALAIADPLRGYAADGARTLAVVKRSGGTVLAVSDNATMDARTRLLREEGLFVEPSAAAVLAGLWDLAHLGLARPDETLVLLLTGHGLKGPSSVCEEEPPTIEPDLASLAAVLRTG
jgi:threonine synthase